EREISAESILDTFPGSCIDEIFPEPPPDLSRDALEGRRLAHLDQELVVRAAAKSQDWRVLEIGFGNIHTWAERKPGPLDAVANDNAPNGERPAADAQLVADFDAEMCQLLRLHQHPAPGQKIVRERLSARELQRAVERKP